MTKHWKQKIIEKTWLAHRSHFILVIVPVRLPVLAFAFLAITFLYTWSLNSTGIITPDEPRYAAIAKHMADSGDFISPILWGEPWFEKPALLYWLSGVGFKLGLPGEFAPRLPIAICSVLFLVFYYKALSKILESRETALTAVTMLSTTVYWFAFSQVAVTDLPLAATFTGTLLAVLAGWRRCAAVLFGLALLAKGAVAAALLLPLVWLKRHEWRRWIGPGVGAIAVASVWYVPMTLKFGWTFWQVFFVEHHLGRFANPALQHVQPFWFYLPIVLAAMVPWTPMILGYRIFQESNTKAFVWTAVWCVFFFSCFMNKLPGYIFPAVPSLCVVAAVRYQKSQRKALLLCLSLMCLMVVLLAAQLVPVAVNSGIKRQALASLTFPWGVIPLAILCFRPSLRAVAAASFLCFAWFQATKLAEVNALGSARPRWEKMKAQPESQCIGDVPRSIRYGLNYYANRTLPDCNAGEKPND